MIRPIFIQWLRIPRLCENAYKFNCAKSTSHAMSFLVILFQLNSATNQSLKNKKLTSNSQYFHFFFGLVYGVNILEIVKETNDLIDEKPS